MYSHSSSLSHVIHTYLLIYRHSLSHTHKHARTHTHKETHKSSGMHVDMQRSCFSRFTRTKERQRRDKQIR